jgi:hypothetical protein
MKEISALGMAALLSLGIRISSAEEGALAVRFSEGDHMYAGDARFPGRGYEGNVVFKDLLLQNVTVVNVGGEEVTLEKVWLEVSRGGAVISTVAVDLDEALSSGELFRQYESYGLKVGLDVVFGAGNVLEPGETLSRDRSLSPREAVLISDSYLVVKGSPDRLAVVVLARDAAGGEVHGRGEIAVRTEKARNEYIFPLETDHWYVLSNVDPGGHHRFTQSTEFALDATILDGTGSPYRGDGRKWEDWYAFGKKVLAAADGEVVRVVDGTDFPIETLSRGTEETWPAYLERIDQRQLSLFLQEGADPFQVAGGNYVILKHANGEHTFYAHLAKASTRVKEGQWLKQGEHIADVGGTGEIPWVHLHFQVTDGIGVLARGLPYEFVDHVRSREVLSTQKPVEPGTFYWLKRDGVPAAK